MNCNMETHALSLEALLAQAAAAPTSWHLDEIWASRDFFADRSDELTRAAMQEAREYYLAVVAEVIATWGEPDFIGDPINSEFKRVGMAIRVAYWRRGEFLACVWYEHEDTELPVVVVLAAIHPNLLSEDHA